MAEPQYIPQDWQARINRQIMFMDDAFNESSKHPPGDNHDRARDVYEATCRDFLNELKIYFNTPAGFANFLQNDLRQKLFDADVEADNLMTKETWNVGDDETLMTAEFIYSLYRMTYLETIEGLSHKKAFHHASPYQASQP